MRLEILAVYAIQALAFAGSGAYLDHKYGSKIAATVTADVAKLKADVDALKAKVP